MNEQLKTLNKKIRLLNDVLPMNALFTNDKGKEFDKSRAEERLTEMLKQSRKHLRNEHDLSIFFARNHIIKIATDLREFFFNKEVVIKRKVVNDRLISVYLQDPTTKEIMPLNPDAFIKMVEKIKLKEI